MRREWVKAMDGSKEPTTKSPYERFGFFTTPESVGRELHKAIALLLCSHQPYPGVYCKDCFKAAERILKPIGRVVLMAGMSHRKDRYDGYAAVGEALDLLHAEANLVREWGVQEPAK